MTTGNDAATGSREHSYASLEGDFRIPVALFIFRRSETVLRIIEVLSRVRPRTLYLIGDGPRTESERAEVVAARGRIEAAIDWPCEVVTNYASDNRGVYANIADGAKWVFEREPCAIFLEDDNLPEDTFFGFCQEMLERYEGDSRVMWICGTNYLVDYVTSDGASYVFTKHLMPCGWASWASKFPQMYDGDMRILEDRNALRRLKHEYTNSALYRQQVNSARSERHRRESGRRYASWDFQMALSIRQNSAYGVCPCRNQIRNIGVDSLSTHGGSSLSMTMTQRFCGIGSLPMESPLRHPAFVLSDLEYERAVDRVVLLPLRDRIRDRVAAAVKHMLGISRYDRLRLANSRYLSGGSR